jgi:hypothetical protein
LPEAKRMREAIKKSKVVFQTATFLMSVESYRRKRMVRWDPAKEEIV